QAEDGIRDFHVTGVQTCALPISIDATSHGEVYLSPCISKAVVEAYLANDAPVDPLSGREREVLQLIAEGKNVKEIGDLLDISTRSEERRVGKECRYRLATKH